MCVGGEILRLALEDVKLASVRWLYAGPTFPLGADCTLWYGRVHGGSHMEFWRGISRWGGSVLMAGSFRGILSRGVSSGLRWGWGLDVCVCSFMR